jgi:hypothetical protein
VRCGDPTAAWPVWSGRTGLGVSQCQRRPGSPPRRRRAGGGGRAGPATTGPTAATGPRRLLEAPADCLTTHSSVASASACRPAFRLIFARASASIAEARALTAVGRACHCNRHAAGSPIGAVVPVRSGCDSESGPPGTMSAVFNKHATSIGAVVRRAAAAARLRSGPTKRRVTQVPRDVVASSRRGGGRVETSCRFIICCTPCLLSWAAVQTRGQLQR